MLFTLLVSSAFATPKATECHDEVLKYAIQDTGTDAIEIKLVQIFNTDTFSSETYEAYRTTSYPEVIRYFVTAIKTNESQKCEMKSFSIDI